MRQDSGASFLGVTFFIAVLSRHEARKPRVRPSSWSAASANSGHKAPTAYHFFLNQLFGFREEVRRRSMTLERILTDVFGARPTMARRRHAKSARCAFPKQMRTLPCIERN